MQTFLSSQDHPYVKVVFSGLEDKAELDCLIDTGFAGGISIPEKIKPDFNFPLIGRRTWELADGSQIELEVYLGKTTTNGKEKEISIIFTDGNEGLVGIEFLRGKKFVLDLKSHTVELS
jgi:clan AA aspartic protease